jgi:hypothetical protein
VRAYLRGGAAYLCLGCGVAKEGCEVPTRGCRGVLWLTKFGSWCR